MSRPAVRRALRRAGLPRLPRAPRSGPRPRIYLPGEEAGDSCGPLDLGALFGRPARVELEIGTGKGRFLLAAAAERLDTNFLGVEIQPDYARIAQAKAEKLGLGNARVVSVDGKELVRLRLPAGSLAALHVYFPDPWPKKRHHKRRLFDAAFAADASRALRGGGELRVASDHPGYWEVIASTLDAEPTLERLDEARTGDWSTGTDYERKARLAGRTIGKAIWVRVGAPALEGAPPPAARPPSPPSPGGDEGIGGSN